MSRDDERWAFLAAIEAEPLELVNHRAYADWLDEYADAPEEAEFHREWSLGARREGEVFLIGFALRHDIPFEDVVDAGWGALLDEWHTQWYSSSARDALLDEWHTQWYSSSVRDEMHDDRGRAEFWAAWQAYTGRFVAATDRERTVFSCSC